MTDTVIPVGTSGLYLRGFDTGAGIDEYVRIANPDPIPVSGTIAVSNFPATQPVSGPLTDAELRATPLPVSGTVTITDGAGPVTVDGTVSVGNFPAVQPVSDNSGSLTVDSTQLPAALVSGRLDINIGGVAASSQLGIRNEDAAHATGQQGVFVMGVRNDSAGTTFSDTNGDYTPFAVDAQGRQMVVGTFFQATQPVSIAAIVEVSDADETLTIPDAVTVGSTSTALVAAGSTGLREIVISVPRSADTGIHINVGAAATTAKFLIEAGGTLTLNTNQAVNAIRAGAADVTTYTITGVPA